MLGLGGEFEYGECASCKCLWQIKPPSDLARYYPDGYQGSRLGSPSGLRGLATRLRNRHALGEGGILGSMLEKRRPNLRMRALRGLPLSRSSRLLDVGCGDGAVVEDLRALGFEQAYGIDPYRINDREGFTRPYLAKKTLDQVDGVWDLIMFHHSFEHMADPADVMARVGRLLSSDGACLIRIPIVPCHAWSEYGVNWVQLDAPRHLFIHSRDSLRNLASGAALRVAHSFCDSGTLQFWGSERYKAGYPLGTGPHDAESLPIGTGQLREYARQAERLNRLGQGDQGVFVLQHDSNRAS